MAEEFSEQLEGTYDILPDGTMPQKGGSHLDDVQQLRRQKLVDTINHLISTGKEPQEAVIGYTREAVFTFLNRFVALKMLEARGLVQQCISKGELSSGFKEFTGLAPGLVAFFGSIIAIIFLKKPKKIPVFIFCWGFILVNKFFEGLFVTIDRII